MNPRAWEAKVKVVLGARGTRKAREDGGKETLAGRPLYFSFLTSTRRMLKSWLVSLQNISITALRVELIVRIRNWRYQFQFERGCRRRQLKEPYEGKYLSAGWVTDWFSEVSSPNGYFYSQEERKETSCCQLWLVIFCLTSNAYHASYALSTTKLFKTLFWSCWLQTL